MSSDQQLIEKAREFAEGRLEPVIDGFLFTNVITTMADFTSQHTADLEARLSLAVEALEHYADEWHWTGCGEGDESLTAGYYEDVWCYREPGNGYDIARQALANIKGEGGEDD